MIELEGQLAVCRIWSRHDVDRAEGARFALATVESFKSLVAEPASRVEAMVLDMVRAPALWGPVTQSCLERMAAMFESAGRRIAVAVSEDELQGAQMERIVRSYAPRYGRVFRDAAQAADWARRTSIPPDPGPENSPSGK